MGSIKNVVLFVLMFSLFLFGRSYPYNFDESFTKSIFFESNGKVEIEGTNGKISIEGWDKNEVYIEAYKKVRAESREKAEELLKQLEIVIEHEKDVIRIHSVSPRDNNGNFWNWIFGDDISYSVSYNVHVPVNTNIDASTTNGKLYLSQVRGSLGLRTTNGGIQGENLSGNVSAHTTNGSLKIEIENVLNEKEMEFTTTNGSITVFLPTDINCKINAETTNGSIKTDFPLQIEGKHNQKTIRGKINEGGPLIFIETTNGSIKILETLHLQQNKSTSLNDDIVN